MLAAAPPPIDVAPPPGGWAPADGGRLRGATGRRARLGRVVTLASRVFTRGRTHRVFSVLALGRRQFRAFLGFNGRLMPFGGLPRADTERVILRTAWRTRSEYEWRQHCAIAQDAGLERDEIAAIASLPLNEALAPRTRTLLRAVDELLDEHAIGEPTWEALRGMLDDARIVELCLLCGNYAMLAGALNSYATPIEPALSRRSR